MLRTLTWIAILTAVTLSLPNALAQVPWAKPHDAPRQISTLPVIEVPENLKPREPQPLAEGWQLVGKLATVKDELLERNVYEVAPKARIAINGSKVTAPRYVLEALVRLTEDAPGYCYLRCGVTTRGTKTVPAYSLTLSRSGTRGYHVNPTVGEGTLWTQPLRDGVLPEKNTPTRWSLPVAERYPLDRISPVWDEDFRIGVENAMTALPLAKDVWRKLRIEVSPERVRMYHNGLLAFDEVNHARVDGESVLELIGPARLAELQVRELPKSEALYEPVLLDDLVNAKEFVSSK